MTKDMNDIARKTKIETVSMKVITLVTLFFLPGTFISVGHTIPSVSLVFHSTTITRPFCPRRSSEKIKTHLKLTARFPTLDAHEHRNFPVRLYRAPEAQSLCLSQSCTNILCLELTSYRHHAALLGWLPLLGDA